MQATEVQTSQFAISKLLEYGAEVYLPVGLSKKIAIRLPRQQLKLGFVTNCRYTNLHGVFIDTKIMSEDYIDCDVLVIANAIHNNVWIVPVETLGSCRTFSLNNKEALLLQNIILINQPIQPEKAVDRNHILDIVKQHGIGAIEQEQLKELLG